MKRAGWTLLVMGTIVVTGSFSKVGAVDASGWAHCASVKQDTERLACYDAMASGTAERRTLGSGRHSERDAMISRCRTQMGEYGSAMVKACVIKTRLHTSCCKPTPMTSPHSFNAV